MKAVSVFVTLSSALKVAPSPKTQQSMKYRYKKNGKLYIFVNMHVYVYISSILRCAYLETRDSWTAAIPDALYSFINAFFIICYFCLRHVDTRRVQSIVFFFSSLQLNWLPIQTDTERWCHSAYLCRYVLLLDKQIDSETDIQTRFHRNCLLRLLTLKYADTNSLNSSWGTNSKYKYAAN